MSNSLHITLTARDIHEAELQGKIAVVIDVLRATSVMITAIANGARWIKAVAGIEEARSLSAEDVLLGGERQAMPIEGFDFSNSPLEYTHGSVHAKGIVLTTTNGTLALSKCGYAREVLIGAFINHHALTGFLLKQDLPVELICAGTNGEFSMDDFLCAGLICSTLENTGRFVFDDLGRLAMQTWTLSQADIHAALAGSKHYNILKSKGLIADLDYCLKKDTHDVLVCRNKSSLLFERLMV